MGFPAGAGFSRACALVVDSGAALDGGARPGTSVIPLVIAFGEHTLRDGVDIGPDALYDRLDGGETPTTSTPSTGDYLTAFQRSDGEHIVCLTIPRHLSGMYQAATLAVQLLAESGDRRRVDVVETTTAAGGFGLVARAAAALCADGAPAEEVLSRIDDANGDVRMFGSLRTLAHLARSGRVPSIAAGVSDVLGVRPIFELRRGEARRVALVRGDRRVFRTLQQVACDELPADRPLWVLVFHSAAPDDAEQLCRALQDALPVGRLETVPASSVMGVYTGPGMTGFAAIPMSEREMSGVR